MKGSVLGVLVATALASPLMFSSKASASCAGYEGVCVPGTPPGGGGNWWDPNPPNPWCGWWGACSSGGEDHNPPWYEPPYEPAPRDPMCTVLEQSNEPGCDLNNPPVFFANGCGGSGITSLVPDGPLGYPGLYTPACNRHDSCYGQTFEDKATCDANLGADMLTACDQQFLSDGGVFAWLQWETCRFDAWGYSQALATNILSQRL
jgi:hypothetical protein